MTSAHVDRDWEDRYRLGETPWDSGLPSRELQRVICEHNIGPSRALELGCGTGTNATYLATQGFEVTAVDCASNALELARCKAVQLGVSVNWLQADVQHLDTGLQPFDFVFDRGCYHCCRRVDLPGYLATLRRATREGSLYLSLSGNAHEVHEHGPPTVTEDEIRSELGGLFDVVALREFRFQDAEGVEGPLGWSALLRCWAVDDS